MYNNKLFDNVLGCDINLFRNILKYNKNNQSAIYLLTLGYVKDLRSSMNINNIYNDNMIICKYGRTNNLSRRLYEHDKLTFKYINNITPKLKCYIFIDNLYLCNAENDLHKYFIYNNKKLSYLNYKELIIIHKNDINNIQNKYKLLSSKYKI